MGEGAHAHNGLQSPFYGFVCIRNKQQLKCQKVLLHEIAHLLVPYGQEENEHGSLWRECVIKIGGTLKPHSYAGWVYPGYSVLSKKTPHL
jgi:hypothetical protein